MKLTTILIALLALNTPAWGQTEPHTVTGSTGATYTIDVKTINSTKNAAHNTVYMTTFKARGVKGENDYDGDIGVQGCGAVKGTAYMRFNIASNEVVELEWFNDSTKIVSLLARTVCTAVAQRTKGKV